MSSTKIINVLKDDRFEELLDIVKNTDASEIIFVLPKNARAFKSEVQFAALRKESKDNSKNIAFLSASPEVNDLAKIYNFDVLSTKTDSPKPLITKRVAPVKPKVVPVVAKNADVDDEADDYEEDDAHDEFGEHHLLFGKEPEEPEEVIEPFDKTQGEEEKDYKESEPEEETVEDNAPYGTELDESGDPIYEEEEVGEAIVASVRTRSMNPERSREGSQRTSTSYGMNDVIRPSVGRNLKITQKDKKPIKLETRTEDISDLGWNRESSDNIWADISRPLRKSSFFNKFKFSGRPKIKVGMGIVILSVAAVVVLAFVVFLTTGSARIEIKPKSQPLGTQLKVTMSPKFSLVDNSFNRIPGQLFSVNKSASDNFNATAEKDAVQKSRGTITIYNEYGTSPQPLIATTRFEYLKDGKGTGLVFRTLQTVTVPGMNVENGVVTPGKVKVGVIADKAGQAYNVAAGDFGVMTWKEKGETAKYEKIYSRSTDSMHGGILGKAKVVSEFDFNNAESTLTAKVVNDLNEALKAQSAGLELLANIKPDIRSAESTSGIDDAADSFTMTVNGSIVTVGYKKEDLMALIAAHVEKINGLTVTPDKLEISYKNVVMNPANETLEATVMIGGQGYSKIDRKSTAANLMGKNELQIKNYISSIKDIDSAKVILSPFWVKKIPKNAEKIDITITY